MSCPPTWAVLRLWRLPVWHQGKKLQHSEEQTVLILDRFLPQGKFFHFFQLILWSSPEDHPLLLLRERKINIWLNLLVEMLLGKRALVWSHQVSSSRFSPNPHSFKMLSSAYRTHLLLRQLNWKCAGSLQNARPFSGPDHGQFNALPTKKGPGGYLSFVAPRGVEAVGIKYRL